MHNLIPAAINKLCLRVAIATVLFPCVATAEPHLLVPPEGMELLEASDLLGVGETDVFMQALSEEGVIDSAGFDQPGDIKNMLLLSRELRKAHEAANEENILAAKDALDFWEYAMGVALAKTTEWRNDAGKSLLFKIIETYSPKSSEDSLRELAAATGYREVQLAAYADAIVDRANLITTAANLRLSLESGDVFALTGILGEFGPLGSIAESYVGLVEKFIDAEDGTNRRNRIAFALAYSAYYPEEFEGSWSFSPAMLRVLTTTNYDDPSFDVYDALHDDLLSQRISAADERAFALLNRFSQARMGNLVRPAGLDTDNETIATARACINFRRHAVDLLKRYDPDKQLAVHSALLGGLRQEFLDHRIGYAGVSAMMLPSGDIEVFNDSQSRLFRFKIFKDGPLGDETLEEFIAPGASHIFSTSGLDVDYASYRLNVIDGLEVIVPLDSLNLGPILPRFICSPETLLFPNALSVDASATVVADGSTPTYSWDWGDGSAVETGATASHSYTVVGEYTVTLTVQVGADTATKEKTIRVLPDPALLPTGVAITSSNPTPGPGATVTLTATATSPDGSPLLFQWFAAVQKQADGTYDPAAALHTGESFDVVAGNPALYAVQASNAHTTGPASNASIWVQAGGNLAIAATPVSGDDFSAPSTIQFSVTGGSFGSATYVWAIDGVQQSTAASFEQAFITEGRRHVTVTIHEGGQAFFLEKDIQIFEDQTIDPGTPSTQTFVDRNITAGGNTGTTANVTSRGSSSFSVAISWSSGASHALITMDGWTPSASSYDTSHPNVYGYLTSTSSQISASGLEMGTQYHFRVYYRKSRVSGCN
ncbi:MAG: PKD domain-containing protein [Verrucomicrobiae bacterium]|nr:PKD domain-containing protein [Verrucomicrobiae bacterium]